MDSPNVTPFIYQDLMSGSGMMPYVNNPFMGGMYQTNLLGGVRFAPQPDNDKFIKMQERNEREKSVFLRSMAALLIIGGSAALVFRGKLSFSKFFKNAGKAIAAPFKWAGTKTKNGAKAVGKGIAAPFKWIKGKFKK